jgi:transcriptional regulator with AAA-type ATPase domain
MALFDADQRRLAECISTLVYCNPFLPDRITAERNALAEKFIESPRVWSLLAARPHRERENLARIMERVEPLAARMRDKLAQGARATEEELVLYEDLVLYMLYQRDRSELQETIVAALEGRGTVPIRYWKRFRRNFGHALEIPGVDMPSRNDPAHVFALFFQIRRAFHDIYTGIVGGSIPIARLRAAVWQSIFTHDMRRYRRVLYRHMHDFTTLVTGPSGTGKELVARAIGQARYIPFDAKTERFTEDFATSVQAVNLSALAPTLIESELFGHKRGAYTGAVADRIGWLEACQPLGTVFVDEVGELDPAIQVKLLRLLQTRTFQRLGETTERRFEGKILAATNKDLEHEMSEGRFRADFYYRLCSDTIATPSLAEQLADDPDDLENLVLHIAQRTVDDEAERLADEVTTWIDRNLPPDYPWPGNFRELEQCVRSVLIRRTYEPRRAPCVSDDPAADLASAVRDGAIGAEDLLRRYCTLVYARTGSYEQAARRLGLDRRTVRAKVDPEMLERLRAT